MTRMAVVLPAPLGPSSTVIRPSGTRIVRFDRAGTRPKFFDTSRISTTSPLGASTSTGEGGAAAACDGPQVPSGGRGLVPDPGAPGAAEVSVVEAGWGGITGTSSASGARPQERRAPELRGGTGCWMASRARKSRSAHPRVAQQPSARGSTAGPTPVATFVRVFVLGLDPGL